MKKIGPLLLCIMISSFCNAQDSLKIISPFPSFPVTSINAVADANQNLTVNIVFENRNNKSLKAYFKIGGFDKFGFTDANGNKYKVHSSTKLIGTKNINEGYYNINSIAFGPKKLDYFTYVQDTVKSGTSKIFSFTINNFDQQTNSIGEIHITCKPSIDFSSQPEKTYVIKNISITRLKNKGK